MTSVRSPTLSQVEQSFLESITRQRSWVSTIEECAKATSSAAAFLFPVEGRNEIESVAFNMDTLFDKYFQGQWHYRDARERCVNVMFEKGVSTDYDLYTDEEIERNDFWRGLLVPAGFKWFAGIPLEFSERRFCLTFQRGVNQAPFTAQQLSIVRNWGHRLSTVMEIGLEMRQRERDALFEGLEAVGGAFLVLDRLARVIYVSNTATTLLGDPFDVRNGKIRCEDGLRKRIEILATHAAEMISVANRKTFLRTKKPEGYLIVELFPLPSKESDVFVEPALIVRMYRDGFTKVSDPSILSAALGLTTQQANIASGLCEGYTIKELAKRFGISEGTARVHLKSIFARTGIKRQSELVSVCIKICGL
jgi:DNA-binding CsgD family transcriptional regulator